MVKLDLLCWLTSLAALRQSERWSKKLTSIAGVRGVWARKGYNQQAGKQVPISRFQCSRWVSVISYSSKPFSFSHESSFCFFWWKPYSANMVYRRKLALGFLHDKWTQGTKDGFGVFGFRLNSGQPAKPKISFELGMGSEEFGWVTLDRSDNLTFFSHSLYFC